MDGLSSIFPCELLFESSKSLTWIKGSFFLDPDKIWLNVAILFITPAILCGAVLFEVRLPYFNNADLFYSTNALFAEDNDELSGCY